MFEKKEKHEISVEDLIKMLKKILRESDSSVDTLEDLQKRVNEARTSTNLVPHLQNGAKIFIRGKTKSIHFSLVFGQWLEKAFEQVKKRDKRHGCRF